MALFSLTDIKFRKDIVRQGTGRTLSSREGFQNNLLRYPEDLGSIDKGHYMMFYINTSALTDEKYACSVQSPFSSKTGTRSPVSIRSAVDRLSGAVSGTNLGQQIEKLVTSGVSKLPESFRNVGNFGSSFTSAVFAPILNTNLNELTEQNFARRTRTIADTIALYMPNTLNFTHNQSYSDVSRNDILSGTAAAISSSAGLLNDPEKLGKNLAPFLAQLGRDTVGRITNSPGTIQAIFAREFGAVNPRIEVLYTSPVFREFQFTFSFYPRSEAEALEVQKIIQKFQFHQAPEIKKGTGNQFLVPPSDFNIEFYYNGVVNDNIPKIKGPCVLKSINVDYAPNGFRAYESYGDKNSPLTPSLGKTGMPVGINMQLSFTEIEFMTKDAYRSKNNETLSNANEPAFSDDE